MRKVLAITIGLALASAGAAEAKTFEATKSGDPAPGQCTPNDCSLREAIRAANARAGSDSVVLPNRKKPYKLSQAGIGEDGALTGDLDVTNDPLKIIHPGKGRATVDAQGIDRVFENFGGAPVRFVKLRIRGGNDTSGNGGGGLRSNASATFTRSVLTGNATNSNGGGVDGEDGALVLKRSRVSGNDADDGGGGVASVIPRLIVKRTKIVGNESVNFAGGIQAIGHQQALITKSTIAGNTTAGDGGGLLSVVSAITNVPSSLKIANTTISGNTADDEGGGLLIEDNGLSVVNSTIADNSAEDQGGGIYSSEDAGVDLNAVTVVRNNSGADDPGPAPSTGGGIYQIDSVFEVRNTLIGLNTNGIGGIQRQDCEGDTYLSLGNNLLSTDVECEGFTATGDLIRDNPKLGPLKKNGGPTKTVALKRGSPAINNAHGPSSPNRDQRGVKRKNPDIGAYERKP